MMNEGMRREEGTERAAMRTRKMMAAEGEERGGWWKVEREGKILGDTSQPRRKAVSQSINFDEDEKKWKKGEKKEEPKEEEDAGENAIPRILSYCVLTRGSMNSERAAVIRWPEVPDTTL